MVTSYLHAGWAVWAAGSLGLGGIVAAQTLPLRLGRFPQEIRTEFNTNAGLPSDRVIGLAVAGDGSMLVGTDRGLARFDGELWRAVSGAAGSRVEAMGSGEGRIWWVSGGVLRELRGDSVVERGRLPGGTTALCVAGGSRVFVGTDAGLFELQGGELKEAVGFRATAGGDTAVRQVAVGETVVAASRAGLFEAVEPGNWVRVLPADDRNRSWAPIDVGGVAWDNRGRLWFGSPQGAGYREGGSWRLFTGSDGLPWSEFTTLAAGMDGVMWFGTTRGAIRYDGKHWAYRQGRRWLPSDSVRTIAVGREGNAWIGTDAGLSRMEHKPMTLAEKANHFERQVDALHRRTPWEYVLEVSVPEAGKTNGARQHDSDNDGLWTAMYGAGECFAYGATKNPLARQRARKAFEALRWLGEVTQGGPHSPPKGYVARTILPADGPDPNAGRIERDRRERETDDSLWKVYEPRWPKSRDGRWYWKSDTSSDELDGHFFFYALYHDLVAETPEEKSRVRDQVRGLMDHIVGHGFKLVDHDGTPTRWGIFDPANLNGNPMWADERGLNSLSLLSYLSVTAHVTGDATYHDLVDRLCREHHYDANLRVPKIQRGIGSGNHSDDEMAFMCFYNLLKYARDERLREQAAYAFHVYGWLELPEGNPFFNFCIAASVSGRTYTNPWGTHSLKPMDGWLEDAVDTLQRIPLDRFDWRHQNAHRLDVVRLPQQARDPYDSKPHRWGLLVDGKVVPADERFFHHWNHNPFELDTGGAGQSLGTGTVFLLPYYMGLYHGIIADEGVALLDGTPRKAN